MRNAGRSEAREPGTAPSTTGPVSRKAAPRPGAGTCVMNPLHFSGHHFYLQMSPSWMVAGGVPELLHAAGWQKARSSRSVNLSGGHYCYCRYYHFHEHHCFCFQTCYEPPFQNYKVMGKI